MSAEPKQEETTPVAAPLHDRDVKVSDSLDQESLSTDKNPIEFGIERTLAGAYTDANDEPDLTLASWMPLVAATLNYLSFVLVVTSSGFWVAQIILSVGGAKDKLYISSTWNLVSIALTPPFSFIGDKVGRRWLWIITLAFGVIGLMVVASAQNVGSAIVGSGLWGVGFSNCGNLFTAPAEALPRRHRGTVAIVIHIGGYVGGAIALFGGAGLIVHRPGNYPGWRSLYWLASALHAVTLLLVFFTYHPPPVPNPTRASLVHRVFDFDIVGNVIYTCGFLPFCIALIWGGQRTYPWHGAHVTSLFGVGSFFILVLIAHQTFIKKDGLFHHGLFKTRNAALCIFAATVQGTMYLIFNNEIGLENSVLFDARPYALAGRFSAFIFGAAVGNIIASPLSYRYKTLNEILTSGFVLFLSGVIGLATVQPGSGKAIIGYCALAGFGLAGPIAVIYSISQLSVDPSLLGLMSGLVTAFRTIGGTIGPACVNAIYNAKISVKLPAYIAKAGAKAGLPASSIPIFVKGLAGNNRTLAASAPGVNPAILAAGHHAYLQAYADSFRYMWIFVTPIIVVGLIACLSMENVRKHMNFIIEQPVEEIHHKNAGTEKATTA